MTNRDLIARVCLHSGLDEPHACIALEAVLASLRSQLGRPEAEALAEALPDPLAEVLRRGSYAGGASRDALETQVAFRERLPVEAAREHLAAVCRALAESLPELPLDRLRHAVPSVARLLADEPVAPLPAPPPAPRRRPTLSDGRPGSGHPISEGRADRAQPDSIAAENPHGDTKLSSSSGLTQEREQESLASAHPPGRPRLP